MEDETALRPELIPIDLRGLEHFKHVPDERAGTRLSTLGPASQQADETRVEVDLRPLLRVASASARGQNKIVKVFSAVQSSLDRVLLLTNARLGRAPTRNERRHVAGFPCLATLRPARLPCPSCDRAAPLVLFAGACTPLSDAASALQRRGALSHPRHPLGRRANLAGAPG
jgi:hypothetical protein